LISRKLRKAGIALAAWVLSLVPFNGVEALVISEIHYNPLAGEDDLEFVEITNDAFSPEDVSGWAFVEGIRFEFPPGTILEGGETLAVCANVNAVEARYGVFNVVGNFEGALDGSGERLTLVNHAGVIVQDVRYNDGGSWPVAPDGTGHTLTLRNIHTNSALGENWIASLEIGGSPGQRNLFLERPAFNDFEFIGFDRPWNFRRGTGPFSDSPDAWQALGFDDSSWESGLPGFGFGDDDDVTLIDDMENNYTAVAFRLNFVLTEEDLNDRTRLLFEVNYDDGFCAFVNGVEFAAGNCPEVPLWDERATRSREARPGREDVFEIPSEHLQVGDNVLAAVGYNFRDANNDFSFIPRLLIRRFIDFGEVPEVDVVFNELFRGSGADAWVELYNATPMAQDLSGWLVTDDPDRTDPYAFPAGTVLPAQGFLVLSAAETRLALSDASVSLFLQNPDGFVLQARRFDQELPGGASMTGLSEALFPDGGRPGWLTVTPTPGDPNEIARTTDIVINEIFYHPPEGRRGEFVEIFHRGDEPLDLGGFRFSKGIDYTFPAGQVMGPGEFLVVAEDPALLAEIYGLRGALGPYEGQLADAGERLRMVDTLGNLVDEVDYKDGGDWSLWADGRGSSLELVDPRQNNDLGVGWAASDETDKSEWEEFQFDVPSYISAAYSELRLLLSERGTCLVDDVFVTTLVPVGDPLIALGEEWRFLRGTAPFSNPPTAWIETEFDDSSWSTGPSGFGFGDDDDATLLQDMRGVASSLAIRKSFPLTAEQVNREVVLRIDFDDGFCAYINGHFFAGENCPNPPVWDALATGSREAGRVVGLPIPNELLREGENVLAIVGYNRSTNGPDFSLAPEVILLTGISRSLNVLPNGDFENELEFWRLRGTHFESERIETDSFSGGACLRIAAVRKGDGQCNGIEVETEPRLQGDSMYSVSLAARWQAGTSLLLVSGGFGSGPWPGSRDTNLAGNSIGAQIRMTVPQNLGTPGAENSATAALRTSTGAPNLGPLISSVLHSPPVANIGSPAQIRATVEDADGVATVRALFRSVPPSDSVFTATVLTRAEANTFRGEIPPPQATGRMLYYVEAEDSAGNVFRYPPDAPHRTLVYQVSSASSLDDDRPLHISTGHLALNYQGIMSNSLVHGTVVHDDQVFYNVGLRYRGSPWGRPSRQSLRVRFPKDNLFKGTRRDINVSNRDRENDGPAHFMVGRNGRVGHPAPALDYKYIKGSLNGSSLGTPGIFETFDRRFIEKWFDKTAAQEGVLLKANGRISFDNGCNQWRWDEANLQHRGDDRENYRFYYSQGLNQNEDRWEPFYDLTRTLDVDFTDDQTLDETFDTVIDFDAFFRTIGPRIMTGDGDALYVANGHNGLVFWDPTEELWHYFAVDFGGWGFRAAGNLLTMRDGNLRRLLLRPEPLRRYYAILNEYMNGYWNPETAGPYLTALRRYASVGDPDALGTSRDRVVQVLSAFVDAELRILTRDGSDFEFAAPSIRLQGEAPVTMASFLINVNGAGAVAFAPTFSSAIEWETTIALADGPNTIEIVGFDMDGELLASVSVTVTRGLGVEFVRGDTNRDGRFDLTDPLATLLYVVGELDLSCPDAADADDSGIVDTTDAVRGLEFIFRRGPPPPPPFPAAGRDVTEDELECAPR